MALFEVLQRYNLAVGREEGEGLGTEVTTTGCGMEACGMAGNVESGAIVTAVDSPPDVMTDCCRVCIEYRAGIPNGRP